MKTAPLLRIRPDGTPEMLVAGTLADGPRYEARRISGGLRGEPGRVAGSVRASAGCGWVGG